jgi:hypothetical protein
MHLCICASVGIVAIAVPNNDCSETDTVTGSNTGGIIVVVTDIDKKPH